MKRKVRITPPDSNPFESNSMSTWMAKMGGTQANQENKIVYAAAEMLSQGIPQDEVVQTLTEQGIPVAVIDKVMNSLFAYVDEQRDLSEANYLGDELTQEQILADQEMSQRDMMYEQDMSEDDSPMYYSPDTDPGYAEEDAVMDEVLMKFGGKIPTKGQYIKKQLKLKRKQEGGPEESYKADDTLSEKRPINKFIQKVTEIAQEKSDKESLEEEYNQMFGNQMFGDEELPEAQFGGGRNARRAQRQLNRATRKMNRMLPNGFNALSQFMPSQPNILGGLGMFSQNFGINPMMGQNLQLANIDVHRSGLFGKPKEYTINFNTAPPVKNEYNDLVKQEEKNVESTVKEIEEKEKEKETTTASTENEKVQEELITADQIQVVGSGKNKTKNTTVTTPQLKKDAWGRSENDEWYGFDPNQGNSSTRDIVQPIIDYAKRPQGPKLDDVKPTSWKDDSIDPNSELGKLIKLKEDFAHRGISEKQNPALVDINKRINDLKNKSNTNKIKTVKPTASESSSSIFQNPYLKFANNFLFQKGGFTDQDSGLYKFIGGGDDAMIPFADESFRFNSEDTTDPNFQYGGLYPRIFNNRGNRKINRFRPPGRAIEYAGSYLQQQGVPIDPITGQPIRGISNPQLKSIKSKNGLFNINPKTVTYTYTGQAPEGTGFGTFNTGFQPRKDYNTPYSPQGAQYNTSSKNRSKSDNKLPGAFGPRNDEFMQNLWERRAKRKGYDIDWSTDGMVSPEDYQGVDKLQTRAANPLYTSADELRSRQDAALQNAALMGDSLNLPLRRNLLPTSADEFREPIIRDFSTSNNISAPDYEDELNNEIVDVIPEDLTDEYTGLPSELAANRNLQTVSPIVNTAGPMNESNYSYDMPGEGENYVDEYEQPYSPTRNEMLESLGRGPSNIPFYPIGENAPLIGPDGASEYIDENLDYNMDLPYETELPEGRFTQKMVDDSQRSFEKRQAAVRRNIEKQKEKIKNSTRREVKQQDNSLTTEPVTAKPVTEKQNLIAFKDSNLELIKLRETADKYFNKDRWGRSPDDKYYGYDPDTKKYTEVNQLAPKEFRQYREQLITDKLGSEFIKNYGRLTPTQKLNYIKSLPNKTGVDKELIYALSKLQLGGNIPVAQTMGQFNMSTPYANKNAALTPKADSLLSNPFKTTMSNPFAMDENYQNPLTGNAPAIRMGTDGQYVNEGVMTDDDLAKLNQRDMSIDYKVKDMYNIDGPEFNNKLNNKVNFGANFIDAYRNRDIQDDLNLNLTSDNVGKVKKTLNQGTFDPLTGTLEPNKMGYMGVAQYGGYMKEGGDMYDEDDETWMSEDQVRQFLAEGGELEFI